MDRPAFVAVDRRRLLPREAADDLPIQARVYARTAIGHLTNEDLRQLVAVGMFSTEDDPDAVNSIYAQGW
jgi:hypothetical protein